MFSEKLQTTHWKVTNIKLWYSLKGQCDLEQCCPSFQTQLPRCHRVSFTCQVGKLTLPGCLLYSHIAATLTILLTPNV